MRGSVVLSVCTVVAGLLQLFPPTSVIIMFIGGMYWFGVFANLTAFVLMYEVFTGRSRPAFLIIPVVLYSAYTLYAYESHKEARRVNSKIDRSNSLARVAWDSNRQSLMLMPGSASTIGDVVGAQQLIEYFDINAVYAAPGPNHDDPTLVEVQERPCPSDRLLSRDGLRYNWPKRGGYPSARPFEAAVDLCVVAGPALTPPRRLLVYIEEEEWRPQERGLVSRSASRIWIKVVGKPIVTLHYGRAMPVTWFPMPMMGCLVGGGGELGCSRSFNYEQKYGPASYSSPSPSSKVALVARVLRIERKPLWERYPRSKWRQRWASAG